MDARVTEAELFEAGRAARARMPRSATAEYVPPAGRDPLGIILKQNESRLPDLVQLRVDRMSTDVFAFYRGTAAIQVADLRHVTTSGAQVVICGDAHLNNFGVFRSPEQAMVFDTDDFDEAFVGPWEWDLKRLLTSVVLAGRSVAMEPQSLRTSIVLAAAAYRDEVLRLRTRPLYERYFTPTSASVESARLAGVESAQRIAQILKKASKRTSSRVARRILGPDESGVVRFVEDPPILVRVNDEIRALVDEILRSYRTTVSPDLALMLSQYSVLDVARRVVGVGSVGTRCFIVALGDDTGDVKIVQIKEAVQSVVNEFGGVPNTELELYAPSSLVENNQGYRVVSCQRVLQAVSDPFLGYVTHGGFDFYVRLFRNMNASVGISAMNATEFHDYARACAVVLARGHSRSPNLPFIAGYLGSGKVFVRAVAEWAYRYASQAEEDYALFMQAASAGMFASARA